MLVTVLARIAAAETSCALVREWKAQVLRQVAAKIDDAFLWSSAQPLASETIFEARRQRWTTTLVVGRLSSCSSRRTGHVPKSDAL